MKYWIFPVGGLLAYLAYKNWPVRIIDISDKLPRAGIWPGRDTNQIIDITIHHAASNEKATAYDFARWHIQEKGWPGIGYHFVIDRDGNIFQTNPISAYSYHNGYNNGKSIGICMVGNFQNYPPTLSQKRSLTRLIIRLKSKYNIKYLTGHREYPNASTSCPGKYVSEDYFRVQTGLRKYGTGSSVISLARNLSKSVYDPEKADN